MEFLEANLDWMLTQLQKSTANYFIFDCPGQVELYTHHQSMHNVFGKLEKLGYRLCAVHLVDSHYCSEPHKFISALLLSLHTMLQMSLPHINVLSKADQFKEHQSKLLFNLEYYTEVLDLKYLLEALDEKPEYRKYKKLNEAIVSMVEDYGLVTFQPLDVNRTESLARLYKLIDKANGYVFGANEEQTVNSLVACAVGAESEKTRFEQDVQPYME
jgi:GPN-loop GTPase